MTTETHLGDGLYASLEDGAVILRAPRAGGDHFVVLENKVLAAFLRWVAAMNRLDPSDPNAPAP